MEEIQGTNQRLHGLREAAKRLGVASRVAMALMRHSDRRLTDKVYTDENLLGTWGAIDSLPSYAERASQIAPQILGAEGQSVSSAGTTPISSSTDRTLANIGESHVLTLPGTSGQKAENGGSGGARTRHKSNKDGSATGVPSQIASQESRPPRKPDVLEEAERLQVYRLWPELPPRIRNTILSLVEPFNDEEEGE